MAYEYQLLFGILAPLIGILSFVPYYRDVLNGSTKPHVFTWIIWTLLTGTTFLIQISEGGGTGAWVTGVESLSCFGVALLALRRGETTITRTDWICFVGALGAMILWLLADQPLLAIILVICADGLGFAPTFRKSYSKPQEETATIYALSAAHWIFGIMALQSFAPVNWLYPAVITVFDLTLVALLIIRRQQII